MYVHHFYLNNTVNKLSYIFSSNLDWPMPKRMIKKQRGNENYYTDIKPNLGQSGAVSMLIPAVNPCEIILALFSQILQCRDRRECPAVLGGDIHKWRMKWWLGKLCMVQARWRMSDEWVQVCFTCLVLPSALGGICDGWNSACLPRPVWRTRHYFPMLKIVDLNAWFDISV